MADRKMLGDTNYPNLHEDTWTPDNFWFSVDKAPVVRDVLLMKSGSPTLEPTGQAAPTRWDAVDFLVDFPARPKRLGLLTETLAWVAAVALFRRIETESHYLAEPTDLDRRYHKSLLAALIAAGERLLTRIFQAGGLPANLDGAKTEDIDAMVEELRNTQAQWYGDMTPERRAQILKEVFDVPPA